MGEKDERVFCYDDWSQVYRLSLEEARAVAFREAGVYEAMTEVSNLLPEGSGDDKHEAVIALVVARFAHVGAILHRLKANIVTDFTGLGLSVAKGDPFEEQLMAEMYSALAHVPTFPEAPGEEE